MAKVHVERLDHLGVLASVIKDIGVIDMMNARLVLDQQAVLTPGEAMAGMMLNGLGFAHRPWSLTPQFFASQPRDQLFHDSIRAEMFNRFKLGRPLDEAYAYGCDLLLHELALGVCARDGIDLRFNHLDTTSFSLTGEYGPDSDEQAMTITPGYSRDQRPDLKPAVLELMVSQDGGIPWVSQRWDGNTSDIEMFQARTQALLAALKSAPSPRYLIADSQLYHEDNAPHLRHLGFITRLPHMIGAVSEAITHALALDSWARLDEETRYQRLELCHDGMTQRWLVVFPRPRWSALRQRSTKPANAKMRRSTSSSYTFKLNASRRLKRPTRRSPHWPRAGCIT